MATFGLPYTGSKSKIAKWLVEKLPECNTFVDVFAGGCAVTHAMILAGKAKRYIVNDIQRDVPELFIKAFKGEVVNDHKWISREDFFTLRDSDPLVRLCWSFGNDGLTYLYGKGIEPYKRSVHIAIVQNDWTDFESLCPEVAQTVRNAVQNMDDLHERRMTFQRVFAQECKRLSGDNWYHQIIQSNPLYKSLNTKSPKSCKLNNARLGEGLDRSERILSIEGKHPLVNHGLADVLIRSERINHISHLHPLPSMESGERIDTIAHNDLPRIESYGLDYRDLPLPKDALVFCDPPYATSDVKYRGIPFDNTAFIEWCIETAKCHPVYVTEYVIDNPHFQLIGEKARQVSMNGIGSKGMKVERLYRVLP